jgi:hypothetical protein
VRAQREADEDGTIYLYEHMPDGSLVKYGVIEKNDAEVSRFGTTHAEEYEVQCRSWSGWWTMR